MKEFNDFIKKWTGNNAPYLLYNDENDAERFRDKLREIQLTRQKCEEEFFKFKDKWKEEWTNQYKRIDFKNIRKQERQATIKQVIKEIEKLNESFRKDNIPQKLSGDEFNDKWEEELKAKLEKI